MGKVLCKCGEVIVDIDSPCTDLLFAIPDEKMWPLVKQVIDACGEEHPTDFASAAIAHAGIPVYRCPHCERLLVFWNGCESKYSPYRLESDAEDWIEHGAPNRSTMD